MKLLPISQCNYPNRNLKLYDFVLFGNFLVWMLQATGVLWIQDEECNVLGGAKEWSSSEQFRLQDMGQQAGQAVLWLQCMQRRGFGQHQEPVETFNHIQWPCACTRHHHLCSGLLCHQEQPMGLAPRAPNTCCRTPLIVEEGIYVSLGSVKLFCTV